MKRYSILWLIFILTLPLPATACSLCGALIRNQDTLSEEMARARVVFYGRAVSSSLETQPGSPPGAGKTLFKIEHVIKDAAFLNNKSTIFLDRYVPVLSPKDPPRYLVFCDLKQNKLEVNIGRGVRSEAVVDYLAGGGQARAQGRLQALVYYFRFFDHADETIATDAFREFSRANDQEVAEARRHFPPEKVRALLQNPRTNPEFVSLLAFILGGCGDQRDAQLLKGMLDRNNETSRKSRDGLLAGYLSLAPQQGWELLRTYVADAKKPFPERYSAICAMRFCYGLKLGEYRSGTLRCLEAMLQSDEADMAVEDLRKWQMWDLTKLVLAQYDNKAAAIARKAIVRYALCCPLPEAGQFVARVRIQDIQLVRDVEAGLQLDK